MFYFTFRPIYAYSERIYAFCIWREPYVHESKQLIAAVNSFEHRRSNHAVASVFTTIRWYSVVFSGIFSSARLFRSSKIVFRLIRVYSLNSFDIIARPRYQISPLANLFFVYQRNVQKTVSYFKGLTLYKLAFFFCWHRISFFRTVKNGKKLCFFFFASPKYSFDFQEEEHSIIDWKIFKNQTRRQDKKKCDKYKIGLKCDSDIFNLTKSVSLSTTEKNEKKTRYVEANHIDNKQICCLESHREDIVSV